MAPPPSGIVELANRVAAEMVGADLLAPIGCHTYHNQARDVWEVSLFASLTETVGGPCDGLAHSSPFLVDLGRLQQIFDSVERIHWQALPLGPDDELGPHVSIEGTYQGNGVWIRLLAEPPERFPPGRNMKVHQLRLEELW